MRPILPLTFWIAAAAFGGCASQPDFAPVAGSSTQGTTLVQAGHVTDIRDVTLYGSRNSGFGATVGALLGGIAGSNVGSGLGRAVATTAGAAAGGVAGQRAGEAHRDTTISRLTVRLENGDVRTYDIESGEPFRIGEPVKIITTAGKTRITH